MNTNGHQVPARSLDRPDNLLEVLHWAESITTLAHPINDTNAATIEAGARAIGRAILHNDTQWTTPDRQTAQKVLTRAAIHVAGSITEQMEDDDPRELACWALWAAVNTITDHEPTH